MAKEKTASYPVNGYMIGTCPACNEWEAPITTQELERMAEQYAYHGSTRKTRDPNAKYHRLIWIEKFQCPKCKNRFGVKFSSI